MLGNALKPWHIIVLIIVIVLLFGAKRLPDLAKSVGESLRIFKKEVKDLSEDDGPAVQPGATPAPQPGTTTTPAATPPPAPPTDQQPPAGQQSGGSGTPAA